MELRDIKRDFYTVVQLSKNMYFDNDGTLICKNAVLGKVGTQAYSARELGLDSEEVVLIHRPEHEVFDKQSIASLKGKALTLLHPEDNVTIDNYKDLAKGVVLDVRREGNLMIGDLRVYDKEVIELIRSKKMVELSLGYNTKLKHKDGNKLEQTEIVYNHVALVPKGRAEVARLIDQMEQTEHQIRDKQLETGDTMETGLIHKVLESLGLKKRSLEDGLEVYELPIEADDNENVDPEETVEENTNEPEVTVTDEEVKDQEGVVEEEQPEVVETQEEETPEPTQVADENPTSDEKNNEGEKEMDKFEQLIEQMKKVEEIKDEDMKKALKDQLLNEMSPQEKEPNDNSALEQFGNQTLTDNKEIEKFDFNKEYLQMLKDINPDNYESYGEYDRARKKIGRETKEEVIQELLDEALSGGNL